MRSAAGQAFIEFLHVPGKPLAGGRVSGNEAGEQDGYRRDRLKQGVLSIWDGSSDLPYTVTRMAHKPDNTLYLLGKYLGMAFLLPSGAVAGYLMGRFAEHFLHWPGLPAAGIILGVLAALVKLIQELIRDSNRPPSRT
jgi:hypothetical protein